MENPNLNEYLNWQRGGEISNDVSKENLYQELMEERADECEGWGWGHLQVITLKIHNYRNIAFAKGKSQQKQFTLG